MQKTNLLVDRVEAGREGVYRERGRQGGREVEAVGGRGGSVSYLTPLRAMHLNKYELNETVNRPIQGRNSGGE